MEDYVDEDLRINPGRFAMASLVADGEKFVSAVDVITWLLTSADVTEERNGNAHAAEALRYVAKTLCEAML